ncbi:MAG: nucleoid-associated protein [Amphritea sp.]|nr:nucleoid-associated protein [Amphritea sp.]
MNEKVAKLSVCKNCSAEFESTLASCPSCDEVVLDSKYHVVALAAVTGELISDTSLKNIDYKIGSEWPINDDVCYRFISKVEDKFKRKNKFHSYYGEEESLVSDCFMAFSEKKKSFLGMADSIMKRLRDSADNVSWSNVSGGSVVFMQYRYKGEGDLGKVLVIMVDKKDGFDFDGDLVPKNADHINIDAIRQAALIDLEGFVKSYPEVPENDTYLKFIQGISKGAFFTEALGCEKKPDNKRSVQELTLAIDAFSDKHGLPPSFYNKATKDVDFALEQASKNKKAVSLDKISQIIEAALPDNVKLTGTFRKFVNAGFSVDEFFEPTSQSVEKERWVEVESSNNSFKLRVYKKKVGGSGSGAEVEFNEDESTVLIKIKDPKALSSLKRLVESEDE